TGDMCHTPAWFARESFHLGTALCRYAICLRVGVVLNRREDFAVQEKRRHNAGFLKRTTRHIYWKDFDREGGRTCHVRSVGC
ncbi:MAG TPA: hypothetical protein VJQ25_13290, partial [Nitrospira sp.]|nr:hypothetical protein [Nitrospira sp.]